MNYIRGEAQGSADGLAAQDKGQELSSSPNLYAIQLDLCQRNRICCSHSYWGPERSLKLVLGFGP